MARQPRRLPASPHPNPAAGLGKCRARGAAEGSSPSARRQLLPPSRKARRPRDSRGWSRSHCKLQEREEEGACSI